MKKIDLNPGNPVMVKGKIVKKIIFIISMGFISLGLMGSPKLASKQQIGMFKNSKTCVVLDIGSMNYNIYLKDAVEKFWKSTEYEFIDQQEFDKRRSDSRYSFLVLMKGVLDNDPGGVSYDYITLVLGDPTTDLTRMPELCSIPVSYSDDNNVNYEYVIPAIVKFIQIHVKNLETKRFLISLKGLTYYNRSADSKDKVLLFNKATMAADADSPAKINTVYPYYVKLLSDSEIQEELSQSPTNALFNFHVGPTGDDASGKCFEMIFDIEGNLYYYNSRRITNENGDGFNLKDFYQLRF
jgi:hypothetical protein